MKKLKYIFVLALALSATHTALAQTPANITGALAELSTIVGQTITDPTEAHKICNQEKYISNCAEIGKKYNLYKPEVRAQVDNLLPQIKNLLQNNLKSCTTDECYLNVAKQIANIVRANNPDIAQKLNLTTQKINEKEGLISAAKNAGVKVDDCKNMDPDTASIELLRACVKLFKDSRVQLLIPQDERANIETNDQAIALKEALTDGSVQCGDNTINGCSKYCLNPSAEVRAQGVAGIPQVCRDIAQKYFGPEGEKHLEASHSYVSQVKTFFNAQVPQDNNNGERREPPAGVAGLSQECISAYQARDFERARTLCAHGPANAPGNAPGNYPGNAPGNYPRNYYSTSTELRSGLQAPIQNGINYPYPRPATTSSIFSTSTAPTHTSLPLPPPPPPTTYTPYPNTYTPPATYTPPPTTYTPPPTYTATTSYPSY